VGWDVASHNLRPISPGAVIDANLVRRVRIICSIKRPVMLIAEIKHFGEGSANRLQRGRAAAVTTQHEPKNSWAAVAFKLA
jgi:hypothetical protein